MLKHMRLVGDFCHVVSILTIFWLVRWKGNAAGVSLKSKQLYLFVFLLRYTDLFTEFYSWYNTCMKVIFIGFTAWIVFSIRYYAPAKSTYLASQEEAVSGIGLAVAAIACGTLIHLLGNGVVDITGSSGQEFQVHFESYEWQEMIWTISICLEPLAVVPQLYVFFNNRLIQREIRIALFLHGIYRCFYISNWIYWKRHGMEEYRHHVLVASSSWLQVIMYLDFVLYHCRLGLSGCAQCCAAMRARDSNREIEMRESEIEELIEGYPRKTPTKMELQEMSGMQYI